MRALLVGADRLGNIPEVLADHGISVVGHVSGRNPAHQRRMGDSGRQADLMILFTDFLGHNVMKQFRDLAGPSGDAGAGLPGVPCPAWWPPLPDWGSLLHR